MVVAPIFLHLVTVAFTKKQADVEISAQNCSKFGCGAYTGEISPEQLKDMNIPWVIIGHSERRTHFSENNTDLGKKVENALKNGLKVIYCFGETEQQREAEQTINVIQEQLEAIRAVVGNWDNVVLAYEPVWAIGTGKTATPDQVKEIHTWIRGYLEKNVPECWAKIRIIYGGSVNDKNCHELIQIPDVDGFLVGGASLKPTFIDIVSSAKLKN